MEVRLDVALSRVRRLSPQQRKIVCTLHDRSELSNKEVAKYCFASEQAVASQLGILEKLGIASKRREGSKGDNRKSFWSICDQEISDAMTFKSIRSEQFMGWEHDG